MEYIIVAPTVAELGRALPERIIMERDEKGINLTIDNPSVHLFADTEANARAKLWLYLTHHLKKVSQCQK